MCPAVEDKEAPTQPDDSSQDYELKTDSSSWPEEDKGLSFFAQTWQRWTYSFMYPVLAKGARQFQEGSARLSSKDLFPVPESMRSSFLAEKFL